MAERGNDNWQRGLGTEDRRENAAIYCTPENGFAELADTYDARLAGNPLHLLESTEVLSALPDCTDLNLVDIGCGTGRYTLQMARVGAESVTGIDIVPEMLAIAERKAQRAELPVQWRQGDLLERLPVTDDAFDVAVCAVVFSFLPEWERPLAEIARVLKPGGCLILSDYHPHGLSAARATSRATGRKDNAPYLRFTTAGGVECRMPQYPYRLTDVFQAAQKAGLVIEHIAEPVCDRRLADTYSNLREMVGIPLALILRLRKV